MASKGFVKMDVLHLTDDVAWDAVKRRDRTYDGHFVTGVLSTGIYCRPSCAARHPHRKNVRFFSDGVSARQIGLRACKRCLPDNVARDEVAISKALEYLASDEPPRLARLAEAVGYAPHHFSRIFKRDIGMTPAAWIRRNRLQRAEQEIASGVSVTEAIYAAGYSAPSRFYADRKELGESRTDGQ